MKNTSRRTWTLGLLLSSMLFAPIVHGETCAATYAELSQTERLQRVQALFKPESQVGMVNESKGSYLKLQALEGKLSVVFYTSGLFDLFPIKKEGPIQFCDTGDAIKMVGLGRSDSVTVADDKFQIGKGGPKRNFSVGLMPAPLKKLHKIDERGLAAVP